MFFSYLEQACCRDPKVIALHIQEILPALQDPQVLPSPLKWPLRLLQKVYLFAQAYFCLRMILPAAMVTIMAHKAHVLSSLIKPDIESLRFIDLLECSSVYV